MAPLQWVCARASLTWLQRAPNAATIKNVVMARSIHGFASTDWGRNKLGTYTRMHLSIGLNVVF